jgi:ATP-dependent Lhr-like helicase
MFSGLEGIVVDEAHAFIGSERGAQLQSLLHRLEAAIVRRVDRIGLSATLGDPLIAAEFLRPKAGKAVRLVQSTAESGTMRALIIGFEDPGPDAKAPPALQKVAEHIYSRMRGKNNLVFANARNRVEALGDLLVQKCEVEGVPVEFGAHHGSLSKELRLDAEERLKEGRPFTAVCTSTLEMGIDIGSMAGVGQVGVPPSVASLRQRVGRSGRRGGDPPTLWMYAMEKQLESESHLMDRLRVGLFQQAALLELMAERWCEPPRDTALHLSTLVQQCLSAVAERGGISPLALYRLLCQGPFARVDQSLFIQLLRDLGAKKVLVSGEDGTLLAGEIGERMLAHYGFYAAFASPEEYRIVCDGRTLGTLPIDKPVHPEGFIVFGARRWKVIDIDDKARVILVERAKAGKAPVFGNDAPIGTHAAIRRRMRELYEREDVPGFLDAGATKLLQEGRAEYRMLALGERSLVRDGSDAWLFLWDADSVGITLALALGTLGLQADGDGLAVEIKDSKAEDVLEGVRTLSANAFPGEDQLASLVSNKMTEKHDHLISDALLKKEFAAKVLDVEATQTLLLTLM